MRRVAVELVANRQQDLAQVTHPLQHVTKYAKRPLEPVERLSEILFGLIMVLTFTCSVSVTESRGEEIRTMLVAAVGCNLAWGIIDAFMYLLASFVEQGRNIRALQSLRGTEDCRLAHSIIANAMPPMLGGALSRSSLEEIRIRLSLLPGPPDHPKMTGKHWWGALAVFVAVFASTFPVVIPFLIISDSVRALRISNVVAVVLLFSTGYAFGQYAGYRPWRMGLCMAIIGSALVALTIILGG